MREGSENSYERYQAGAVFGTCSLHDSIIHMNEIIENQKILPADIAMTVADEDMNALLKSGAHIGHVSSKTHPKTAPFIYTVRSGIAIFDLFKTKEKLLAAEAFVRKIFAENKTILFVGTKPAARSLIVALEDAYGVPVVVDRWIGGTLTNFKVVSGRVQELERLLKEKAEGGFKKYTKKETAGKEDEIYHLQKSFGGLRKMKKLPDALFLSNIDTDILAVKEAIRMKIPVVAIVNSNSDMSLVLHAIPANDNSIPAVTYLMERIRRSIEEGRKDAEARAAAASAE